MFKVERKMEMEDVDISEDAILGIQCPLQTDPKEQPFQLHLHIRGKTASKTPVPTEEIG